MAVSCEHGNELPDFIKVEFLTRCTLFNFSRCKLLREVSSFPCCNKKNRLQLSYTHKLLTYGECHTLHDLVTTSKIHPGLKVMKEEHAGGSRLTGSTIHVLLLTIF